MNLQGMSWNLCLDGGPRSSSGINSLQERGTWQREEARVLEPTVPTRGLTASCRICKRRFPLSPDVRAGGDHTVSSALGASSREVSSPLFTKDSQPQGPLRECPRHGRGFTKNMQTQGCIWRNKNTKIKTSKWCLQAEAG